jgi:hypothetical protein
MLRPTLQSPTPLLMAGPLVAVIMINDLDAAETEQAAQLWAALGRGVLVVAG